VNSEVAVTNWLGLEFGDLPISGVVTAALSSGAEGRGLPASISCHTSIIFTNVGPQWQVLYERDGKAVVVEQRLGEGTIALSAITYFVSNEAMRNERHPGLLAWLVGGKTKALFDEAHHGIFKSPGIAVLARKYRLEWLGAWLLLLALLFVWQKSVSLAPSGSIAGTEAGDEPAGVTEGKDSHSGLVNILRRNIARKELMGECVSEWRKTAGLPESAPGRKEVDLIAHRLSGVRPGAGEIVDAYNEISTALKNRTLNTANRRKT
jgi:hypothetical protein